MTGKGTGAIATVQVCGDNAESVIKNIFKSISSKPLRLDIGQILLGTIHDDVHKIDQVTIGCEGPGSFAIHCHGNPLIVEMIIQLLRKQGVQIISDEELQTKILSEQEQGNTIALEAQIAQAQAVTLEGTKIILHQVDSGLNKVLHNWLISTNNLSLESIRKQADEILQNSSTAKLVISGCKTVLLGPPNSGKSTLLNCLSGKQKSIVTDISGTTRDWVSAQCKLNSLSLELIDTAGLDENLSSINKQIDNAAQKKTLELMNSADLILLVLDSSRELKFDYSIIDEITNKKIITVLNKSDLPQRFNINELSAFLSNVVRISAKEQSGIDNLISSIYKILGISDFDHKTPICFTERQKYLIIKLKKVESIQKASEIIRDLQNQKLT